MSADIRRSRQRTATASSRPWTTGPPRRHDHRKASVSPTNPTRAMPTPSPPPPAAFAGLDRRNESCFRQTGGGGDAVLCQGPFSKWGGYNSTWPAGGYTTQLDIYLDAGYATANNDSFGGNMAYLLPPGDAQPTARARASTTRRPSTTPAATTCATSGSTSARGWSTTTARASRSSAQRMSTDRSESESPRSRSALKLPAGTRSAFSARKGFLKVLMEIIPASGGARRLAYHHGD